MKLLLALILALPSLAQPKPGDDALLNHMTGTWVLTGTIAGKPTTHDVEAAWVLNRGYIELRETSREKDGEGRPAYSAIVYIGVDPAHDGYACLWLDSTGPEGLNANAMGHAPRATDKLAFVFVDKDGGRFHTTFLYDKSTDTWQWTMDAESAGQRQNFARVKLVRK